MARVMIGVAAAAASFVLLGTVAALWENPIFIRITSAGYPEIILLGAMSGLCQIKRAGPGRSAGACPFNLTKPRIVIHSAGGSFARKRIFHAVGLLAPFPQGNRLSTRQLVDIMACCQTLPAK